MKASDNHGSWDAYKSKKAILMAALTKIEPTTISLQKNSSNLFRSRTKDQKSFLLDVREFNQILDIDTESMTATVEGMTTYEELVKATLAHNCLPAVVPELKSITIGGAAAGLGIESSSFRYGLVHESIVEMEILLGDGQVLLCTPENEHSDLFFAFPNTYGTLGYALRLKIKLIPAKKYIKLTHRLYTSSSAYFEALNNLCQKNRLASTPIAYIDGTLFGPAEMYSTVGEFVDQAPYLSDYKYMDVYYHSIKTRKVDFLTTADYIWRWDADWFWCSKQFGMENRILRFFTGRWMLSSVIYARIMHFFHRHPLLDAVLNAGKKKESVIQDVLIPIKHAVTFWEFLQRQIPILPVWICPTFSSEGQVYDFCPLDKQTLYVDFGFWGEIPSIQAPGYYNRKVENEARTLAGLKSLYSFSYYTYEEFWSIYNHSKYAMLKQRYDPHGLLKSLFEKCCK